MPKQEMHKVEGRVGVYFMWGTHRVTRKPEKIFYITYQKNGKTIHEKAGRQSEGVTPARASSKRELRMAGKEPTNAERRAAEKAAKAAKANQWTIAMLWDRYCEAFAGNKGLKREKRKFDLYLKDDLGKKEPTDLLPLDVDRLRLKLQKAGKRTQAARILELLRRTVNFGVKRGLIAPLPFKIEIPKLNNQTTEDLTPGQIKKLLKALDADKDQITANIFRIALFVGLRKGEILKLKWTDIDQDRDFITLRDPKGGPDQKVPLSKAARGIFDSIDKTSGNEFVFPGRFEGTHLTIIPRESLKRIRKAAKLPEGFRPIHGLRHVYASMLASSGQVDMYTLQKLLTHKSPQMTQRYAHLRDESLKKAADVAGDIVTAISTAKEEKTA